MPKAYWGINNDKGLCWAMSDMPFAIQWGETEEKAKKGLTDYLEKHHGITMVSWEPFPKPVEAHCHNCGKAMMVDSMALARVAVCEECSEKLVKERQ